MKHTVPGVFVDLGYQPPSFRLLACLRIGASARLSLDSLWSEADILYSLSSSVFNFGVVNNDNDRHALRFVSNKEHLAVLCGPYVSMPISTYSIRNNSIETITTSSILQISRIRSSKANDNWSAIF